MRCPLALGCLLFALSISCAKEDEPRAPRIGDCTAEDCDPDTGGGVYVPPPTSRNDAMAPPTMVGEDSGTNSLGTLTGDVMMLTGTDLKMAGDIQSEVEISALAGAGGRATARYDGDEDFSLANVQITGNLWVGVEAVGNPTRSLMRTLQAVNSTKTDPLHLKVVERASIEEIAAEGALLTPVALDREKGHVVIYFVDTADRPISGIRILDTTAINGAVVAYDGGNTYNDSFEETDAGGSALLLNVEAIPFPGEAVTIAFNHDGLDSSFVVDVARDAITLAVVGIN